MGTSVTPNIVDFLVRIDPFDKLPKALVESLANSVQIKYLVKGETITSVLAHFAKRVISMSFARARLNNARQRVIFALASATRTSLVLPS